MSEKREQIAPQENTSVLLEIISGFEEAFGREDSIFEGLLARLEAYFPGQDFSDALRRRREKTLCDTVEVKEVWEALEGINHRLHSHALLTEVGTDKKEQKTASTGSRCLPATFI